MKFYRPTDNDRMKFLDLMKGIEDLNDMIICALPDDDGEHDEFNIRCKCHPFVQAGEKGYIIIHNNLNEDLYTDITIQ